jgi:hypothetical protein
MTRGDIQTHRLHIGQTFDDPAGLFDRIGSTRPAAWAPQCVRTALLFHYPHQLFPSEDRHDLRAISSSAFYGITGHDTKEDARE